MSVLIFNYIDNTPLGEALYTTPGTYTWVCPADVTSVCAVAVGGGGGGTRGTSPGFDSMGGGGGDTFSNGVGYAGGTGAVRIIWGTARSFPSNAGAL